MSLPRYPHYKDSGVDWLGEVPGHWDIVRLKRVLGNRITDGPHTTPIFTDNGIPFLSVDGIQDGELQFANCRYISAEDHAQFSKKAAPKRDDLLLGKAASVGKVARVKVDFEFSIWSPLALIRVDIGVSSPGFFEYSIKSPIMQAQIDNLCTSNTQKNISMDDIPNLILTRPPLNEQTQIATFLDRETAKIDALVGEQRALMALLKEKRQTLISHAVTRGLNPHAPMKPSGVEWLGDVPAHWEVTALKRIADVQGGIAKGKDHGSTPTVTVPYLRVANVQDGYLDLDTVATMAIPASDLARYSLRNGDVLMNEGGDFDKLGRGCIWECQIDPCVTQNHVFAVRPKLVSSAWLNAITGADFAQFYFMSRSKQSTNLASISSSNLMDLPVVLPPPNEQQEILNFLKAQALSCDTLTTQSQRAITLLQERRSALISAAVTGQINVRGVVAG